MATNRFRDFDAAFAEEAGEPITVRLFGEEWKLPASLPARTVLRIRRAQATLDEFLRRCDAAGIKAGDKIPDDFDYPDGWKEFVNQDEVEYAKEVCGADNVDAWLQRGITMSQLRQIAGWAIAEHEAGARGEDDDEGNGKGRREPADRRKPTGKHAKAKTTRTRSSRAGGSSKRTSSASTGSGSRKTSTRSRGDDS